MYNREGLLELNTEQGLEPISGPIMGSPMVGGDGISHIVYLLADNSSM